MSYTDYTELTTQDITPEFVETFYDNYIAGWFETGGVDWDEALRKYELNHDLIVFPEQWSSPVIAKLKREIRKLLKNA